MIKVQLDRENYCRLTHPQKRIWYIDKINADSQLHTIGGCLKIKDKINIYILEKAINIVIENNDGLRLRLCEKNGQVVQYIYQFDNEKTDFIHFSNFDEPNKEYEIWEKNILKKVYTRR